MIGESDRDGSATEGQLVDVRQADSDPVFAKKPWVSAGCFFGYRCPRRE